MSIINLAAHRQARKVSACVAEAYTEKLTATYSAEGRELADLAHPIVEPFRQCEPQLEQHLKGAFLRWQIGQIKAAHAGDQIAIGLALAVTVEAFTDRMVELQHGFDPNDGGRAA
jgi:hypothetical protein